MSDLRKDPTRGRWVLVRPGAEAPRRLGVPVLSRATSRTRRPRSSPTARRARRPTGPGWSVRVIPEADPYFRIEQELVREGVGLYDRISPRGATELIVESPSHDDTPATLGEGQWEQVLWMYAGAHPRSQAGSERFATSSSRGATATPGSRITHPYSRLTAIPIIFDEVRRKLRECREYYEYKRRCVYCDIIRQEIADEDRVVRLTDHFAGPRRPTRRARRSRPGSCRASTTASTRARSSGEVGGGPGGPPERATSGPCAASSGDPPFEMTLYTAPNLAAKILPGEWSTIADDYHWHIEVTHHRRTASTGSGAYTSMRRLPRRPPSSSGRPGSELGQTALSRRACHQNPRFTA